MKNKSYLIIILALLGCDTMVTPPSLQLAKASEPSYNRSDWGRWKDADGDCQDTRQEVLIAESVEPVTYKTTNHCKVLSGKWKDPYSDFVTTNPSLIDIDHVVSLKEAFIAGGHSWTNEKRSEYFNDLSNDNHLTVSGRSTNRSKGSRNISEWLPKQSYICKYVINRYNIFTKWQLHMSYDELDKSLMLINNNCNILK